MKEGESVKTTNEAILHERDILVNKRLDVDAAKGRFNSVDTIDEMQVTVRLISTAGVS